MYYKGDGYQSHGGRDCNKAMDKIKRELGMKTIPKNLSVSTEVHWLRSHKDNSEESIDEYQSTLTKKP